MNGIGVRRVGIRRGGGGRRTMVMYREVTHAGAFLDERAVGEPNPKELDTWAAAAAAAGGAGSGVMAIVAAVRATPSHCDPWPGESGHRVSEESTNERWVEKWRRIKERKRGFYDEKEKWEEVTFGKNQSSLFNRERLEKRGCSLLRLCWYDHFILSSR